MNQENAVGDIRIGGHYFDGSNNILAHGFYPYPLGTDSVTGDIHFDQDDNWVLSQPESGFDLFTVMAHEIGHAIGIAHSEVSGALMYPYYSGSFLGLQADDIAAVQYIYGNSVPEPPIYSLFCVGMLLFLMGNLRSIRSKHDWMNILKKHIR